MLLLCMRTRSIFNLEHVVTGWSNASAACNMLRPTMLRNVAFKFCDRLAGACECWTNIVGICCVEMLLSFGPGFTLLHHFKYWVLWFGDFWIFFFLIVGSAACPKEGTTNLHLDMSDAVNIMVSSHIVLFVSNFVRGTGWRLVKQTNCEAHSSLYIFKVKLSPALNPIQL